MQVPVLIQLLTLHTPPHPLPPPHSPLHTLHTASRSQSYADINTAVAAMARFGAGPRGGSSVAGDMPHMQQSGGIFHHGTHHGGGHVSGRASPSVRSTAGTLYGGGPSGPYMGKLESIASSAVRAAEKVCMGVFACLRTAASVLFLCICFPRKRCTES